MPICLEAKCVFVHVPKCAGTSMIEAMRAAGLVFTLTRRAANNVERSLAGSEPWLNHLPALRLRQAVGEPFWDSSFKFAFVRNPWDRMVSYYHYHKERVKDPAFRREFRLITATFIGDPGFNDWVRRGIYVPPATDYITDESGRLILDFVGQHERMTQDFSTVCDRLHIPCRLPHAKRSTRASYRDYYAGDVRDLIATRFASDIERFSYEF